MNLGRDDGRTAGVRGARHAVPGPGLWRPVVVIRAGTMGLLPQLLLLARGRVLFLSWTGSASGWRPPPQAGRCPGLHRRDALDGARLEVAADATGVPEAIEAASGCSAMAGGWWSPVCRQPRPRSASRRSGFIAAKSSPPGRWLSCAASARPDGGYRTAAASPACWPRSGTSRSDQHFITCSSHFPGRQLRSVTDLGIPPARRRYRCRTARLGSKPGSVLIAPEPGGGLGRDPGCDLIAFGKRPRSTRRAGGRAQAWPPPRS